MRSAATVRLAAPRLLALLALGLVPLPSLCQSINVLWYTYAHPESIYIRTIQQLADVAHRLPPGGGPRWNLTFFRRESPRPAFGEFNVLVIHSAEPGFTGQYLPALGQVDPKRPYIRPEFRGILRNKAAIAAARGERTFITGTDADVHAIWGDTGNAPPDPENKRRRVTCHPVIVAPGCWDGALGHLVNAVNWAGSGRGLGIVSLVAAEYPGALWWYHPRSFLRRELRGKVTVWGAGTVRENHPVIPETARGFPLNAGLTSRGLGNWNNSFHAGFSQPIPGYVAVVNSTRYPGLAVAIATEKFAHAGTGGPARAPAGSQSRQAGNLERPSK